MTNFQRMSALDVCFEVAGGFGFQTRCALQFRATDCDQTQRS